MVAGAFDTILSDSVESLKTSQGPADGDAGFVGWWRASGTHATSVAERVYLGMARRFGMSGSAAAGGSRPQRTCGVHLR